MQINLRISIWNANELSNHTREAEKYLHLPNIDIFLFSETHFTDQTYFQIERHHII